MDPVAVLWGEFDTTLEVFNRSPAIAALLSGRLGVGHYKSILREVFQYSREDPQIQALATVFFRGADRRFVKMFLKHATMEVGHDEMALADLAALGEDAAAVRGSRPLPSTMGLISFPFYQINYRRPVGYLGYLYFLEYMPTQAGKGYGAALALAGVPGEAMSFLREHMTVDVGHNKLMEQYLAGLVHSQEDLDAIVHAMRTTAYLYARMLDGAVERAGPLLSIPSAVALQAS